MFKVIDTKTGKEADIGKIASQEDWARRAFLLEYDMDGFYIGQDGRLILMDDCCHVVYPPKGRFRIEWESEGEHEQ